MWKKLISIWKADDLLKEAWEGSYEMLRIDQEMFLEAVRILRQSDSAEGNQEVLKKDRLVDQYEQEVRRKVLTHCTVQGPSEMPQSMVLVTIVINIERIGDYTKNIVNLAKNHPQRLRGGKFEEDLCKVEAAVKENFVRTRTSFEESDQTQGEKVLEESKWISRTCDEALLGLLEEEDPEIRPGQAVALALYFRWLKRINSHLGDIATSVVNPFDRIGFKPKGGNGTA